MVRDIGWINILAYAGALLMLAKSEEELAHMNRELPAVCAQCGLGFRAGKLCLWRNSPRCAVKLGDVVLEPQASM